MNLVTSQENFDKFIFPRVVLTDSFRLAQSTKILYSFSILVGWLLQFYVPMKLLAPWLSRMRHSRAKEAMLRIVLTVFTCKLFAWLYCRFGPLADMTFLRKTF